MTRRKLIAIIFWKTYNSSNYYLMEQIFLSGVTVILNEAVWLFQFM